MLEARDLRAHDGRGGIVLDGISVMVNPGEVVTVVGPAGAGKSTLLRIIAGLFPVQGGAVRFRGVSLTGLPAHRRVAQGLAYVPEAGGVLPRRSVLDNVMLGAWSRRDRAGVRRDLERVWNRFPRLAAHRRLPAGALPAGGQRLVALARGLMAAPAAILIDEPLGGLGPEACPELVALLEQLRAGDVAVLAAEHDLRLTRSVACRAYGLRAGRAVFGGSAAALAHPAAADRIFD